MTGMSSRTSAPSICGVDVITLSQVCHLCCWCPMSYGPWLRRAKHASVDIRAICACDLPVPSVPSVSRCIRRAIEAICVPSAPYICAAVMLCKLCCRHCLCHLQCSICSLIVVKLSVPSDFRETQQHHRYAAITTSCLCQRLPKSNKLFVCLFITPL